MLSQIVPKTTGHNGYEEYLHAADVVGQNGWSIYENWLTYKQSSTHPLKTSEGEDSSIPQLPPGVSPEMTDLAVRRVANENVGGAFDIVRLGNDKEVFDPRTEFRYDTLLPEFSRFRALAKVGANRAHVEFSEGRNKQAVEDLIEGLRFSSKILGITRISCLVAIAVQSVDLKEFQEHMGQLSLYDAQQVDKTCTSLIKTSPNVALIFKNERSGAASALQDLFEKMDVLLPDDTRKTYGAALQALSPADQMQLKSMVYDALDKRLNEEEQRLSGPEAGWLYRDESGDIPPTPGDKSVSNLALVVLQEITPKSMEHTFVRAMARGRVQLRLLRLHAKVVEFHWLNNRWPAKIEEFADVETALDPFEQGPFHYELKDSGYRIYSTGVPGYGPIELSYKPLSGTSSNSGSTPPPSR